MCENGAVSALVRLSESNDTYLKNLCAQVFCNLSFIEVGRNEMQKPKKIRAIVQLCKSAGLDTKRLAIKCLSNMLYHVGSKLAPIVMEQGGLSALVILSKFPDSQIEVHFFNFLFNFLFYIMFFRNRQLHLFVL